MIAFEPESRVLSISFERDPLEHADVMLESGRRFTDSPAARFTWPVLIGIVLFGAALGVTMELYRRHVLALFLPLERIPPLDAAALQFLPFVAAIVLLYFGRAHYLGRARRKVLAARFDKGVFIDSDIYREGLSISSGPTTLAIGWEAIKAITLGRDRLELECDAWVIYYPARAFPDRRGFVSAAAQIRALWTEHGRMRAEDADLEGAEIR